jgi:hypothetical protein
LGVLASFRSFPTFTDLCLRGKQFQNFELWEAWSEKRKKNLLEIIA